MLYPDFHELVELKARVASHKISSNRLIQSLISGGYYSPFKGQGLEFEEVRQYVAGDDIRKIDWQVTARSGKPHIKLFREERERKVLICHDLGSTMRFGTKSTFKSIQAAKITALLGWCALSSNNMVGGCLFGDIDEGKKFYNPSNNHNSFLKILQHICDEPVINSSSSEKDGLANSIDYINQISKPGMLIFIISDFLEIDERIISVIANLNRNSEVVLISVNDPADFQLQDCGVISVTSSESAGRSVIVDTSDESLRRQYSEAAENNAMQLENMVNRNNIIHIPLFTNSDLYFDLFSGVRNKMTKRRGGR